MLPCVALRAQEPLGNALSLKGTVPALAGLSRPSAADSLNMTLDSADLSAALVRIASLVEPETGLLRTSRITLRFEAFCNTLCDIGMASQNGGLKAGGDMPVEQGAFTQHVNYGAQLIWGNLATGFETTGAGAVSAPPLATAGPARGELTLTLEIQPGGHNVNEPILSGTYQDVLTISLMPRY